MKYPQGWKKFCNWRKKNPDISLPSHLNLSELNRFAARFRLAQSYEGMILTDYPESTVNAYSSLFGVFLAYSALEQLYKAVGKPGDSIITEWGIIDKENADKLRRSSQILTFLHDKVSNNQLRKRIDEFRVGNDDNILVIAQALRHLIAHGIMTIYVKNVFAKTSINFCNLVKKIVLDKTQNCFTEYIKNSIA